VPRSAVALAVWAALAGGSARVEAADRPGTATLVAAGSAMAVPTYFLFVALHESTHALAARAFGCQITAVRLLPSVRAGHFYFGYTDWRGPMTPGQLSLTLLAPKATDAVVLIAYSVLVAADGLPSNAYGSLALTVLGTGAWVDFAKDVIAFGSTNDIIRLHALAGRTSERQRWPWRVLHAALAAAAAVPLYQGYRHTFRRGPTSPALVMPLMVARF
jgi:hypothetical protein